MVPLLWPDCLKYFIVIEVCSRYEPSIKTTENQYNLTIDQKLIVFWKDLRNAGKSLWTLEHDSSSPKYCQIVNSTELSRMSVYAVALWIFFTGIKEPYLIPVRQFAIAQCELHSDMVCATCYLTLMSTWLNYHNFVMEGSAST